MRTPYGNCQTPSITERGFNKCFLNPGLFKAKQTNGITENNPNKRADVMFKCCPDRRANVSVCFQCESVFHYRCAKKLDQIQFMGKVKVDCCCNGRSSSEESDNKSLSENVEELKKVLCDLKEENHHLKEQVATLQTQHVQIISSELDLKKSEETLKKENLIKENNLLRRLIEEMTSNNELLKEKNEMLTYKLNKKSNICLRQRLGRVLKRKRKRPLNTVEPEEL